MSIYLNGWIRLCTTRWRRGSNLLFKFPYWRLEVNDLFPQNNKKFNFVKIRITLRTQNIWKYRCASKECFPLVA